MFDFSIMCVCICVSHWIFSLGDALYDFGQYGSKDCIFEQDAKNLMVLGIDGGFSLNLGGFVKLLL